MKRIILLTIIFLTTSCLRDPVPPKAVIEIDESAIMKIDSIEVITNSFYGKGKEADKVLEYTKEYVFGEVGDIGTIRLKLKDETEVRLDSIRLNHSSRLLISERNGKFKIEPRNDSRSDFKIPTFLKILLFGLILLIIPKVVSALLIMSPDSSRDFMLKYGLFSLILVIVSTFMFGFGAGEGIILFSIGLIFVFFVDFLFLYNYCDKKGKTRPIIAVIVSNLLLLIGIYFFTLMTIEL